MEREIKLTIPDDIKESFKKSKHKIAKMEYCGNYAVEKLEKGFNNGTIAAINDDLEYIVSVSKSKEELSSLPFISSYYTFLENKLVEIMGQEGIAVDTDRKKTDMLIALKKCQFVLTKFGDEEDASILVNKALQSFEKTNPQRFYFHRTDIERMCLVFINIGLGKIKIDEDTDSMKVGGKEDDVIKWKRSFKGNS